MKEKKKVQINVKENWGQLVRPEEHDAAVGARIADNKRRDFVIFNDRITVVGEESVAKKLRKWLFSASTLKKIKANTSFSFYGGEHDGNHWASRYEVGGMYVTIDVTCNGEYAYVRAYADKIPDRPNTGAVSVKKYWYRMKIVETVESVAMVASDEKRTAKQLEKEAERARVSGLATVTGVKDVDIYCEAAGEGEPPDV